MRGRVKTDWWGVVLEAPDALALARFYSSLLGWPIAKEGPDGAAIQVPGTSSYLAFDDSPDYVPPVWPAKDGHQRMMMHIDIAVDDLAAAVAPVVSGIGMTEPQTFSWRMGPRSCGQADADYSQGRGGWGAPNSASGGSYAPGCSATGGITAPARQVGTGGITAPARR